MSRPSSSLFSAALVGPALLGSVRKLDPRAMIRNPVMFVVEVVAALTTVLFARDRVTAATTRAGSAASRMARSSRSNSSGGPPPRRIAVTVVT